MTIEQKIERITSLAREREQLSARLDEIDGELQEMLGGKVSVRGRAVISIKTKKVRGG